MLTFAVLLFAYVLSQFFRAFLAIVAGDLMRDLGLDARQLGDLSAIWFATFAIAQFPVGIALDRFGARITIVSFMVLAVAGAAWFAMAQSFAGAMGAMALIGIGCSPVLMGSLYVFGLAYPPERFAMLASLIIGLGSTGNLLGAAPLAWAVTSFGWRPSLAAIAAVTAISVAMIAMFLREPPRPAAPAASAGPRDGLLALLLLRPLWLMVPLTLVGYAFVIALRSLWIAPFLQQVHAFDAVARGEAALVMAATMSLGALAYGPIERWAGGAKPTVVIGSALTAAAIAALGLFGARNGMTAVVIYAAIGAFGMTYGILMGHARLFFPRHLLGRGRDADELRVHRRGRRRAVDLRPHRQVRRRRGPAPAETFATLHLGFAAVLAAATAVYLFTPARPSEKA